MASPTEGPHVAITEGITTTIYVTIAPSTLREPSPPTSVPNTASILFTVGNTVYYAPVPTGTISRPAPTPTYLVHTGGIHHPNDEQIKTIWIAVVMLFCILVGWNLLLVRTLMHPWKMLINLLHEMNHVFAAVLTGANVYSITIDPDKGPISGMTGGQPLIILSAGYIGSILTGSGLIIAAFDTSASKIACLSLFPIFPVCFWFGRWWAQIRIVLCIGVSIAFWFIDDAYYLRFYILFIGVMNAFYVVWDVFDDLLFRKENESDAALFARMSSMTIHAWFLIWLLITMASVSGAMIAGLHFFDRSVDAQLEAQRHFLPT